MGMQRLWIAVSVAWLTATAILGCTQSGSTARAAEQSRDSAGVRPVDQICGPRCVQYILKHYGQEADVIDLTREMQYPELEKGTTLQAIADALERRGVHTFPMRIVPQAQLKWSFPVVVHLTNNDSTLGHFVVWLPPQASDGVNVWLGVEGMREMPESDWAKQRSGAVLLTAPQPIGNPQAAVTAAALDVRGYAVILAAVVIGAGLFVLVVSRMNASGVLPSLVLSEAKKSSFQRTT